MKYQRGFFLIEVVVVASIVSVVLVLLLGSIQNSVEASQRSLERTQASYLLEEGAEALKSIRSNAWTGISSLTAGTTYYLAWSNGAWSLSTTPSQIDNRFTRTLVMSDVSRDVNGDIVTSGGTTDAGTKKFTITTTWVAPSRTYTESLELYLTDI